MNSTSLKQLFIPDRPVVFLHAHCDDESFLSAGLLNKLCDLGRQCIVIYGAAATVPGEEKTVIRQQQTIEACSILGIDAVIFLKYCEPRYSGVPLINQKTSEISREVLEVLKLRNVSMPINLISYDKNGGYGNKDHKVIHKVGREIRDNYSDVSLFEVTLNRDKIKDWIADAKTRLSPESLPQLEYWSENFGLLSNKIQFGYELTNKELELKRKALSLHTFYNKPDIFPLSLNTFDFKNVLGTEYIHIPS